MDEHIPNEELRRGSVESFWQAIDHYDDGKRFETEGKIAKAFYFYHMAAEESVKSYLFRHYCWISCFRDIDLEFIRQYTRQHKNLQKEMALICGSSKEEIQAMRDGLIPEEIIKETAKYQQNFYSSQNKLKNDSFYVQIKDKKLQIPKEMVTESNLLEKKECLKKCINIAGFGLHVGILSSIGFDLNETEKNKLKNLLIETSN